MKQLAHAIPGAFYRIDGETWDGFSRNQKRTGWPGRIRFDVEQRGQEMIKAAK